MTKTKVNITPNDPIHYEKMDVLAIIKDNQQKEIYMKKIEFWFIKSFK